MNCICDTAHTKGHSLRSSPGDVLGDLVAKALVGALVLLGAGEHLLGVLCHGLLVVTVAVGSGGVVLQHTKKTSASPTTTVQMAWTRKASARNRLRASQCQMSTSQCSQ